ncbi:hypothetical protein AYI70_g6227 [Smittium culicis]|uniref:Uncharacterized protein n=1 Tax=Smittium culicis TaxID=133412 RepID=A0A1R1XR03_9FUNG|nr:hypothetical protein AYI70_g6227 [Smittium culicis]
MSYEEAKESAKEILLNNLQKSSAESILLNIPIWFLDSAKNLSSKDEIELLISVLLHPIIIDSYEIIVYTVISSLGNRDFSKYNINLNGEQIDPSKSFINYHVLDSYVRFANEYILFFIPINNELVEIQDTSEKNNFKLESDSSSNELSVSFTLKDFGPNIFDYCDEKTGLSLSRLFCEIISAFWLPRASGPALLSSASGFSNSYFGAKDWSWIPSVNLYIGLSCFHKVVNSFSIAESWAEKKELIRLEELNLDRKSIKKINLSEAVYTMVCNCGFDQSILESIGLVFGSKSENWATLGIDISRNSTSRFEIQCIGLLVEIWLEYSLPWTTSLVCRDNLDYKTDHVYKKLYKPLSSDEKNAPRPEWVFRIRRILKTPSPELYLPSLFLFFSSVVPAFDLLSIQPCSSHIFNNKIEIQDIKESINLDSKITNSNQSANISAENISATAIAEKFKSIDIISKDYIADNYTSSSIPPAFSDSHPNSPIQKASILSEAVLIKMKSALGLKKNCGCTDGVDITTIILKVISAFGYGYTKAALATLELAKNKKSFSTSSTELVKRSLWLRDLIQNETFNANVSISKVENNCQILKIKNLGEFKLLDESAKELLPYLQDILLSGSFDRSSSNSNLYASFHYNHPRYISISKNFFNLTLENFYPDSKNSINFFSSHSKTVLPFLHRILMALSTSKSYKKKLSDTLNEKSLEHSSILGGELTPKSFSSDLSSSSQASSNTTGIFSLIESLLASIDIKGIMNSLNSNYVNTIDSKNAYIESAKLQSKKLSLVNNRCLFIMGATINVFGVTPSEISFLISTIEKSTQSTKTKTQRPIINLYESAESDANFADPISEVNPISNKTGLLFSFEKAKDSSVYRRKQKTESQDSEALYSPVSKLSSETPSLYDYSIESFLKKNNEIKSNLTRVNSVASDEYGYSFLTNIDNKPISSNESETLVQISKLLDVKINSLLRYLANRVSTAFLAILPINVF